MTGHQRIEARAVRVLQQLQCSPRAAREAGLPGVLPGHGDFELVRGSLARERGQVWSFDVRRAMTGTVHVGLKRGAGWRVHPFSVEDLALSRDVIINAPQAADATALAAQSMLTARQMRKLRVALNGGFDTVPFCVMAGCARSASRLTGVHTTYRVAAGNRLAASFTITGYEPSQRIAARFERSVRVQEIGGLPPVEFFNQLKETLF